MILGRYPLGLRSMAGFSLVELLIVVAIAGILLAVAAPSLLSNINTARIRGVAESIHTGISLARSEAIRRNAPMRFQLVSTLDNNCAYSAASGSAVASSGANSIPGLWLVSQYVSTGSRGLVAGACGATLLTPPDQEEPCPAGYVYPGGLTCLTDPWIAYRSSADKVPGVNLVATATANTTPTSFILTFGAIGQLLPNNEAAPSPAPAFPYQINITPASGNTGTPYRVEIALNGTARICVPGGTTSMVCTAP